MKRKPYFTSSWLILPLAFVFGALLGAVLGQIVVILIDLL